MSESVSRLRQELWRFYRALARTLRALRRNAPMVQGAPLPPAPQVRPTHLPLPRGELHPAWVLTRSEGGKSLRQSPRPN